jgi:DNA polymerase-3 subunit epsilon
MSALENEVFVCLDCETTGLDAVQDKIIEVAVTKFSLNTVYEEFESLIDPKCPIPESSIAFHHITQDMVLGKPSIDEVLPTLIKIIDKHIIVGHSIGFDIEIIALAADRAGIPHNLRQNLFIDTLRLARLYGESPTNSLEQLRKHFNIEEEGAHRAMSDVTVNRGVFKYLVKRYKTTNQLFDVLSRPIDLKIMPLGKPKGRPMKEIPLDYLKWASYKDFDQDLLYSIRLEIKKRKGGKMFSQSSNPFSNL